MRQIYLLTVISSVILFFTACEKDDPVIPNEEEIITTLIYTLMPEDGGAAKVFRFEDLDGDGGNAPILSVATLDDNTTYTGTIELLNEQESPAESISEEVEEEAEEHQFFFQTNLSGLEINYNDQDADGNPIGLSTTLNTTNAEKGTFTIVLRHEPNKTASGVMNGDISNAGGETDIEVTFEINVE